MNRILVSALLALTAACGVLPTGGGDARLVELDSEFTLDEGDKAVVRGPGIAVQFIGVSEDTRCPIEANCVDAGHATLQLRVSQEGRESKILTVRTDGAPPRDVYSYHAFELVRLEPARSVSEPDPDYRVRLVAYPVFTID
ncbi:hypothetical protein [Longimicrobium sp.]|uniref:hypothetical protein n=1 Tax=Longimicrobium sp. TaxID=2029185 RepID=UPI002E379102|nr:hypothetical protein [Longimicrobium sp.]HEX6041494.1 hypothetical protein [Longimicrobium sp.]